MKKTDSTHERMPAPDAYTRESGEANSFFECTHCDKGVVAKIDYEIEGDHVIVCPWCGHEHCRVIKAGVVTEIRWESRYHPDQVRVASRNVWKSSVIQATTTSTSQFLSDVWLRKGR